MEEYVCKRGHKNEDRIYNGVHQCNACRRILYKINPSKQLDRVRKNRLANVDEARRKDKEYKKNNRDKINAHKAVSYAIKKLKIIKPLTCEHCNIAKKLDGHHFNGYDQENKLNVIWLCRSCHKLSH